MSFSSSFKSLFSSGEKSVRGVVHMRAAFIIKGLRLLEMERSKMSLDKAWGKKKAHCHFIVLPPPICHSTPVMSTGIHLSLMTLTVVDVFPNLVN